MADKYEAFEAEGAWGVQSVLGGSSPKEWKGEKIQPGILYEAMFTEATAHRLAELSGQFPDRDWLAQKEVLLSEGLDVSDPSDGSRVERVVVPAAALPRYPGSENVIRTVSDAYDSLDEAQDALTTISALGGFVFGYVDEATLRTITFHEDTHPNHPLPAGDGFSRVFCFARDAKTD